MSFFYNMVPDGTYCLTGYKGSQEHVVLPENIQVSILNDFLFKGHTEITSIILPDTLKQIGGFVFDGCTHLKHIKLPSSLIDLWQYAFTRTSLEKIEIPGSVHNIIPFTFYHSQQLKEVIFNDGTVSIAANAFKDCTALENVYLPTSLITISENAFSGCGHITFHRV